MSSTLPQWDIEQLTLQQRLDLIAQLWDSIPNAPHTLPVPDWHRQELERRIASANADPGSAIPWEEVRKQMREKL